MNHKLWLIKTSHFGQLKVTCQSYEEMCGLPMPIQVTIEDDSFSSEDDNSVSDYDSQTNYDDDMSVSGMFCITFVMRNNQEKVN